LTRTYHNSRARAPKEKPEGVYEVTPKLDSGSATPTKPRPVPAPNVRACSKSSPKRPKIKRLESPSRETPGREAVVRQNATDLMDEEVQRWAVAAADHRKELFFEYRGRAVRSSSVTEPEH
jgi:hypothetical protein